MQWTKLYSQIMLVFENYASIICQALQVMICVLDYVRVHHCACTNDQAAAALTITPISNEFLHSVCPQKVLSDTHKSYW